MDSLGDDRSRHYLFSLVEGWAMHDALYFAVTTTVTVGYGDFVPKSTVGKALVCVYIIVAISFASILHNFFNFTPLRTKELFVLLNFANVSLHFS